MKLISREPQKVVIEGVTFTIKPLSRAALGIFGSGIKAAFAAGDFAAMTKVIATAIGAIDDPQAKKVGIPAYLEMIEDDTAVTRLLAEIMERNTLSEAERKNSLSSLDGNSTAPASVAIPVATVESVS